ncbi:MAG: tRNA uridine-5-carboxymethylaminomethyl(34) synthesis GTPase MnmE [Trueperaceae bacterium]|nr:tRNA uridine-5-carboxymethylaminomethyl(34) synthesis GTPase MnmE [Trueperaceae bacterium]
MALPPSGDTIAAIATAAGEGAIGIVRVAGPDAFDVADAVFRPRRGRPPSARPAGRIVTGRVTRDGAVLDDAVLLPFRAPHSYTGQDAVELQTHGGPAVLRAVLDACLAAGARPAGPGEFTLRAYLAGKLDLVQAESVLAVVEARSERARRSAADGLTERLSQELLHLEAALTAAYGDVTAVLDYPEEGVELRDPRPRIMGVRERIAALLATADAAALARRGARLAIVGRPNAGKSSLLNALLGFDRSIVSDVPGTTRDYLEAPLELRGVPVTAIDTAGVRESPDAIESVGVERALDLAENADLVLGLWDASRPLEAEDRALWDRLPQGRTLAVASKGDLPPAWDPAAPGGGLPAALPVSATTGDGMEALVDAVAEALVGSATGEEVWVTSDRHVDVLRRVDAALARALEAPDDLMAMDVQDALVDLASLTGRGDVAEATLEHVFANFCVGK